MGWYTTLSRLEANPNKLLARFLVLLTQIKAGNNLYELKKKSGK